MNFEMTFDYFLKLPQKLRTIVFTTIISPFFYSVGKRIRIDPPIRFSHIENISLGNNVHLSQYSWIQTISEPKYTNEPKLIIGDYTSIGMNATISAVKKITIEDHVLFGRNVYISDHGHEFHNITKPILDQGIRNCAEVRIGANSWLGQNCIILPGITIGRNCVVGANAVVTHDIPNFCVVAGIPAKVIMRCDPSTKEWYRDVNI